MNKDAFGKFIADTRRELGMTQQTLANRLHVTDKAVSKWERGLCYPDLTLIEDLAAALELTPAELMACRKDAEQTSTSADEAEHVRSLLDITRETVRRRGTRMWIAMLVAVLVLALAAAGIYYYTMTNTQGSDSTFFVHKQEDADGFFVYIEKDTQLLRLRCKDQKQYDAIVANKHMQYNIVYRWDRFTCQGTLEQCDEGREVLGTPEDTWGSSFKVGSFLGMDEVYQTVRNVYPDPARKNGYLWTYQFWYDYRNLVPGEDDELFAAKMPMVTVRGCRSTLCVDYDKDGVVELWVYTKYDEAPYMLYDLEGDQIVSRFVDNVPKDIRQALSQSVHT